MDEGCSDILPSGRKRSAFDLEVCLYVGGEVLSGGVEMEARKLAALRALL